jgi:hypothetical protein
MTAVSPATAAIKTASVPAVSPAKSPAIVSRQGCVAAAPFQALRKYFLMKTR